MPLGPKRAPGRYDVPVSNGAPAMYISGQTLPIRSLWLRTNESYVELLIVTS